MIFCKAILERTKVCYCGQNGIPCVDSVATMSPDLEEDDYSFLSRSITSRIRWRSSVRKMNAKCPRIARSQCQQDLRRLERKDENSQQSKLEQKKRSDDQQHQSRSMSECAKYFGQTIAFQQQETTEIRSRTRAARASFYRYKQELAPKSYLLQNRIRLFNMVISPTLSNASGTWTLTKEHERMIRSIQRKMLRLIVQT